MPSTTPNSEWIWSEEHKKFYRQVYQDGKWDTIWEEASSHTRADSGTFINDRPITFGSLHQDSSALVTPTILNPSQATEHPYAIQHSNVPPGTTPWTSPYTVPHENVTAQQQHAGPPHSNITHQRQQASTLQVPNRPQMPRGVGKWVQGSYVRGRNLHYEPIDTSFFVRRSDFFTVGKYFAVILVEEAGSTATDYTSSITTVRFGLHIHTSARRFIVLQANHEFCYACPIFTYGGRGTLKPGVRPDEHTIIYSSGTSPQLLPYEPALRKRPICVQDAEGVDPLQSASRLYLGIHHPIQYNVKVKDLGHVITKDIPRLRGYWAAVNREITSQAIEVSAGAQDDDDDDDEDEDDEEEDPSIIC